MKNLRYLTVALLLAAGVMGAASAATSPAPRAGQQAGQQAGQLVEPHAEHDAELRAELSEPFSRGLIAILIANACVVATGVRIARNRSQRVGHAGPAAIDPHDRVLDLV